MLDHVGVGVLVVGCGILAVHGCGSRTFHEVRIKIHVIECELYNVEKFIQRMWCGFGKD